MTAREALELCEILTDLNYDGQQTLLKPELFSKPNFRLVHDILLWFARILSDDGQNNSEFSPSNTNKIRSTKQRLSLSSETDVIISLTDIGKLFFTGLGLRLNLISLYKADYSSCVELLKIVRPIYQAAHALVDSTKSKCDSRACPVPEELREEATTNATTTTSKSDIGQIYTEASSLSREIVQHLVSEEKGQFEKERVGVIEKKYEPSEMGQVLRDAQLELEIELGGKLIESSRNLQRDRARLEEKLRAKEMEIELVGNELGDLMLDSPDYLAQYEQLHKEYEQAFGENVAKYRNFIYLESCVYSLRTSSGPTNVGQINQNHDQTNQLLAAEAKPEGSIGPLLNADVVGTEDSAGAGREADGRLFPETTGPARLLDSLLDGASKPMSVSTLEGADEVAVGATAAGGTRYRYTGRRTTGERTMPELEGLLKEFVEDTMAGELDDSDDDGTSEGEDEDTDGYP